MSLIGRFRHKLWLFRLKRKFKDFKPLNILAFIPVEVVLSPRTMVRMSNMSDDGLDYETCAICGKHIRQHYSSYPSLPKYRCDPVEALPRIIIGEATLMEDYAKLADLPCGSFSVSAPGLTAYSNQGDFDFNTGKHVTWGRGRYDLDDYPHLSASSVSLLHGIVIAGKDIK